MYWNRPRRVGLHVPQRHVNIEFGAEMPWKVKPSAIAGSPSRARRTVIPRVVPVRTDGDIDESSIATYTLLLTTV